MGNALASGGFPGHGGARGRTARDRAAYPWTLRSRFSPVDPFSITTGPGPLVAAAVHDGHDADPDTERRFALDEAGRLREEDPFTAEMAEVAETRLIGRRSRFEVDLNRPPEAAVYRTPDDAWGLTVWRQEPPEAVVQRSMGIYEAFYDGVESVLDAKVRRYGSVVVYDLHTYNHRRSGPDGPLADPEANPEVNIGTGSLDPRWQPLVQRFMADLRDGARGAGLDDLDVRQNIKFRGGHFSRWVHERFGRDAVRDRGRVQEDVHGRVDRRARPPHLDRLKEALAATVPGTLEMREALMEQA